MQRSAGKAPPAGWVEVKGMFHIFFYFFFSLLTEKKLEHTIEIRRSDHVNIQFIIFTLDGEPFMFRNGILYLCEEKGITAVDMNNKVINPFRESLNREQRKTQRLSVQARDDLKRMGDAIYGPSGSQSYSFYHLNTWIKMLNGKYVTANNVTSRDRLMELCQCTTDDLDCVISAFHQFLNPVQPFADDNYELQELLGELSKSSEDILPDSPFVFDGDVVAEPEESRKRPIDDDDPLEAIRNAFEESRRHALQQLEPEMRITKEKRRRLEADITERDEQIKLLQKELQRLVQQKIDTDQNLSRLEAQRDQINSLVLK